MKKILIGVSLLLTFGFSQPQEGSAEESLQIIYGGQLYDKYFKAMEDVKTPKETHPSYKNGKYTGNATWRCKECHGWDLKGKDGAYGKGKHFSGIKGLSEYAGKGVTDITKIIKDGTHAYGNVFGEKELEALALFVSKSQIDSATYIESGKKVKGDKVQGAKLYNNICASCHGLDGQVVEAKGNSKELIVGDFARSNPWEVMHKIRFGHAGAKMSTLYDLPLKNSIDILSYIQGL